MVGRLERLATRNRIRTMELTGDLLSLGARRAFWVIYLLALALAVRLAPWRRLREGPILHLLGGAAVGLMVLWAMRTGVVPGLEFHLVGMTTVTLLLGWSFAVLAGSAALVGVTTAGLSGWSGLPVNALLDILVPATLTQSLLVLARSALPKHFFIYVFVNAFVAGGIAVLAAGYLAAWVLVGADALGLDDLRQSFLPFLPLMLFPEAFLNGFLMSVMVGLRPEWVSSFSDDEYLHGK
jgi:uncharacterized membrane protein